jgi:type IV pilus assembly protein PilX
LVSALAFLLVITLLGVSLFLGVNLQQKAAGNSLEKTRALELANSATIAAERWLAGRFPTPPYGSCSSNSPDFRICAAPPTTPNLPNTWRNAGATPVTFADLDLSNTGGVDTYYFPDGAISPTGVWITYLGRATMGTDGDLYRIDTYAWGGNAKSVVVTQTVFYVGGATARSTPARDLGQ